MALRALIWHADEWLHAAELKLRHDLAADTPVKRSPAVENASPEAGRRRLSFQEWEARKSGVAVISKKEARRRRTAAEFDLRFAR